MAVHEIPDRPEILSHFPDNGLYRWLELGDGRQVYGYAAIAEHEDMLELHLSLVHWGGHVRRHLGEDVEWLKGEARRLGKQRVMGIRADENGTFDTRFFKFAGLFGFGETHTIQTTTLPVGSAEP
ncbi:hypothetical protein GO013_01750 [Pseudodesulfovibrio sp. JC047]|uniref:hypothetical protein n=1 Tax=Pseudodesulfovibrio sp. JC047 TaxID=2683199 RepID=UPI0013D53242|nr:hypothetical protein [Pseudodesulfovibrio sp. JC047]NDV18142.1 hypothetical protein [Pseudodesulfovibrio sp. JC047]